MNKLWIGPDIYVNSYAPPGDGSKECPFNELPKKFPPRSTIYMEGTFHITRRFFKSYTTYKGQHKCTLLVDSNKPIGTENLKGTYIENFTIIFRWKSKPN